MINYVYVLFERINNYKNIYDLIIIVKFFDINYK